MKLKKLSIIVLGCLGFAVNAHANEVLLTTNQPIKITFRIAHKNLNNQPVVGSLQTVKVDKKINIPVSLDNYDRAGIVIVSANGRELPSYATQFDKAEQCSMTTDKLKTSGGLEFTASLHKISCHSYGGVFG